MAPPSWAYQVENFVPPADEELICSICRSIFCDPVQCPCNHVYCKVCISKWLQSNKNCPVCRKRATRSSMQQVVPLIKNLIMKLTLKCRNSENGCEEKFSLEACENHMKNCQFEMVKCKNSSCAEQLLRKDVDNHERDECLFRCIKCSTCNMKISKLAPQKHCCIKDLKKALKEKIKIIKERNEAIRKQKQKIKELLAEIKCLKEDGMFSSDSSSSVRSISPSDIMISIENVSSLSGDSLSISSASNSDDGFERWLEESISNQQLGENNENSQNFSERSSSRDFINEYPSHSASSVETRRNFEDGEESRNNEKSDEGGFSPNGYVMANSDEQEEMPSISENNRSHQSNEFDGYSSDSIEYPRASNLLIEDDSFAVSNLSEEIDLSPQPRRPIKRRHPLPVLSNSDNDPSDNEELLPLRSPKRFWRSRKMITDASQSNSSHEADNTSFNWQVHDSSMEAGPSSRTGPPVDSNDSSGSFPITKFRLRLRKKLTKGTQSKILPALSTPSLGTSSAIFDRTIKLLERYNLESDPEWKPKYASHQGNQTSSESDDSTEAPRLLERPDCSSSDSYCSIVSSSDESDINTQTVGILLGHLDNSDDSSSSDPDWQPSFKKSF